MTEITCAKAENYRERIAEKAREIEDHLKAKHGGLPATTCHRCNTLGETLYELRELLQIEEDSKQQKG